MSDTRHFLYEVVLPAYENFVTQYSIREVGLQRDKRCAADLAEKLLHLPEYAFVELDDPNCHAGYTTAYQYRQAIGPLFPPYEIVCDFGNAWKHRKLDRKGKKLADIDDVREAVAHIRYKDGQGYYYASTKLLLARLSDGLDHDLAGYLVASTAMWCHELLTRKLIDRLPTLPQVPEPYFTRKQADRLAPMRLYAHAQESFSFQPVAMVYDSTVKLLTPLKKGDAFNCYIKHEFHNLALQHN